MRRTWGADPARRLLHPRAPRRRRGRGPASWTGERAGAPVHQAQSSRERELATLAEVLSSLLLRDEERPPTWLSAAFGEEIARVRSSVTTILNHHHLAAVLEAGPTVGRFDHAARRLGTDATAVALAIRWAEIETDTRLPSWSLILRRRTLPVSPLARAGAEASSQFG